jgi:hypothetical protein
MVFVIYYSNIPLAKDKNDDSSCNIEAATQLLVTFPNPIFCEGKGSDEYGLSP